MAYGCSVHIASAVSLSKCFDVVWSLKRWIKYNFQEVIHNFKVGLEIAFLRMTLHCSGLLFYSLIYHITMVPWFSCHTHHSLTYFGAFNSLPTWLLRPKCWRERSLVFCSRTWLQNISVFEAQRLRLPWKYQTHASDNLLTRQGKVASFPFFYLPFDRSDEILNIFTAYSFIFVVSVKMTMPFFKIKLICQKW